MLTFINADMNIPANKKRFSFTNWSG